MKSLKRLEVKRNSSGNNRKAVLFCACICLFLFSGCGTLANESNSSGEYSAMENTDEESGSELQTQDGDKTNKSTIQEFSMEDFQEIEPYLGYLLESLYSLKEENTDPKQMSISQQIRYLDPYVEKKYRENQMNGKIMEINEVRGTVLAKEEVRQILYSISGTEYDDDLSYDFPEYDGFYIFEETTDYVNQLESAVIMTSDSRITVKAKLYMPYASDEKGMPNVVVTMIPNNRSEFGLCVDEVRFFQDGEDLIDFESEDSENGRENNSNNEIVKYVPPEDPDLEVRRQQVMQRVIAEANATEEYAGEEKFSNDELANMALEYYFSLNGDENRDILDVLVQDEYDESGRVPIQILENLSDHTATYEWYYIDPYTAEGEDLFGNHVDLKEAVR